MPGKGTGRQIIPEPTVSTPTPLQGSWGIELGKLLRAAAQHVSASSGCAIPCCGTLGKSLNFPEPQLLPYLVAGSNYRTNAVPSIPQACRGCEQHSEL